MKEIHKFMFLAVVIGLLVNLVSPKIESHFPVLSGYLYAVLILLLALWLLFVAVEVTIAVVRYFRGGRYAVLVYLVNGSKELLLANHPYFKRLIPIGGRIRNGELPDEAVVKRLQERLGLSSSDFVFHPKLHPAAHMHTEKVVDLVRPYAVQREMRFMRGLVPFHYAFVYVCELTINKAVPGIPPYVAGWYSLDSIKQMSPAEKPFDDVIQRFEAILQKL